MNLYNEAIMQIDFNGCNPEIVKYVQQYIWPEYLHFDKGHDLGHVSHVVKSSLQLADALDVNKDMALVIASYHDLGLKYDRTKHHLFSGKMLIGDRELDKWFTREQIEQMRQAVEDHRASNQNEPRSLYGKIVADADRELSVERIILRALLYGLANYPSLSREEQYERMRDHICRKYGSDGYLTLWLALPLQVQALS